MYLIRDLLSTECSSLGHVFIYAISNLRIYDGFSIYKLCGALPLLDR